ncbi:hypothetical protein UlMin_043743 [Ulmus minor]
MVVPLGPGKFYGTSLPRPRYYTDVKFNDERVDPPAPVLDPLLAWANEAHWSMGGLSFKRLRLQGRIEGNVSKLRAEREKIAKKNTKILGLSPNGSKSKRVSSPSPPPAPIATKRRRFMALIDEEEEEVAASPVVRRRRLVKKLGDDFDKVAQENKKSKEGSSMGLDDGSDPVASRTRRLILDEDVTQSVMKVVEEVNKLNSKGKNLKGKKGNGASDSSPARGVRISPRLAKRG